MSRILLVGEPILDVMIPVRFPGGPRLLGCSEPHIYVQSSEPLMAIGGVFYWARFLMPFLDDKNIQVVYPIPSHGFHLKDAKELIEKSNLPTKSITWDRSLYEIQRFVEMEELPFKTPEFIDSKLRIDSGDSHRAIKSEMGDIVSEFRKGYDWLLQGTNHKFVVLADYDLGLFTRGFLKKINEFVSTNVNIIVYARRQWLKYAEYFNKGNCSIVANLEYTLAELSDIEKLHDDADLRKNPFRCIKSRFPKLKQFVLYVDISHG